MKFNFLNRKFWGIRGYEYLTVFIFYFLSAVSYRITIWIGGHRVEDEPKWEMLFNFQSFVHSAGLDYTIKLLLTIPIWWLIFRKFKQLKLRQRLLFHLLCFPLFIALFKYSYYTISGYLDWWRLPGFGQIWDIYIPAMFYLIQFGLFHAYEYYQTNQRDLKLKAELREAALKSELQALKAQLNPHFLYNVFNTISASVTPEQEATREMIAKLSDLFRYQLKASKTDLVSLEEELTFVEKYLDLEKARFEDRLQIAIDVPKAVRSELVPPMLLQPIVENAVKHGIAPSIEGGVISIRVLKEGDLLHFSVADTGPGLVDKSKLLNNGVGFTNTKLRLEKQYGSLIKISDNQPSGLVVEFSIQSQVVPLEQMNDPSKWMERAESTII